MDPKNYVLLTLLLCCVLAPPARAQGTPSERSGQDPTVDFQFGYQAYQEGDLNEARTRLELVHRSDTDYPRASYWLAKTYYALGYNDSAARIWRANDTGLEHADWFRRELTNHRLRYDSPPSGVPRRWEYVGLIRGDRYDEGRNLNPTALERAPGGGWFSASYRLGKVLHYSEEGRVLAAWEGLSNPADLLHVPRFGLLAAEPAEGRISRLTDTGFVPLVREAELFPEHLMRVNGRLFFYDRARGEIVQFSRAGDTVAVVWSRSPGSRVEDVAVGPGGRFWVLDGGKHRMTVIGLRDERPRTLPWDRNLRLRRLWWRRGRLLATGSPGLLMLDPDTAEPTFLEAEGDTLAGHDLMDLLVRGDRMILSSFEASELLIYRSGEERLRDLLVQERRTQFEDFPILRMNLLLDDTWRSDQFRHLTDRNLRVRIENQEVLPSYLRHAGDVYARNWILLVDNRFREPGRWDEIRPYLQRVLEAAPLNSRGSLWSVSGERVVLEPFTEQHLLLQNALERVDLHPADETSPDTILPARVHGALDVGFGQRGPLGILLVTTHSMREHAGWTRVANRLRNNGIPLVTINPTVRDRPGDHPLAPPVSQYQNLGSLDEHALWTFYRERLRRHYTALYRSPLSFQPSSEWRRCELVFQVLGSVQRHDCGYLLP